MNQVFRRNGDDNMRVLWITNALLNKFSLQFLKKQSINFYVDALVKYFENNQSIYLSVATPYRTNTIIKETIDGIDYFALPNNLPGLLKDTKKIRAIYRAFLKENRPDIVNIFGTEFLHSRIIYELSQELGIPCVFFIQGLLSEISIYSCADLSQKVRRKYITLRDIYRRELLTHESKSFSIEAKNEISVLKNPINYIYENDWCKSVCCFFNKKSKGYKINLPIDFEIFSEQRKKVVVERRDPILICNASGYPLKGLHIILLSISILKEKYPNIKLIVPGRSMICPTSIIKRQRYPGYYVLISDMIKNLGLENNVEFSGYLSPKELCDKTISADIFVLTSALENHSSSLKEAMILGMPCIASYVGGVDSYCNEGVNVLLYRFGDYKTLAYKIDHLFNDKKLMIDLGCRARKEMLDNPNNNLRNIFHGFIDCYQDIIRGSK